MVKKGSRNIEYLLLAVFLSLLMLTYGNKLANDFGATGYSVDSNSVDTDKDSVPDDSDNCPGTTDNVAVLERKLDSMGENEWERYKDFVGCSCEQVFREGKLFDECLISFGISRGLVNPDGSEKDKSGLNFKAPFSFVVYGDSRTGNDIHTNIVSKIVKENPGFVVNTGDIVGDGTSWDEFLNIVNSIKDKYYVAIGNHEYGDGGGDGNFFETMKSLPKMDEHAKMNANPSTYFSTQEENIYLIVLNRAGDKDGNAHNLDGDKDQQNWLEEELKKANQLKKDGKIDFIFVFLHKPFEDRIGNKEGELIRGDDGRFLVWRDNPQVIEVAQEEVPTKTEEKIG